VSQKAPSPPQPPLDADRTPARVVCVDAGTVSALTAQLPAPNELEPGSWIAVTAAAPSGGALTRLLTHREPVAPLYMRCTALLACGYAEVCADPQGIAYGRAPRR
jgi:hypothetical protein